MGNSICSPLKRKMSRDIRFPTMWYVRPAKAQTCLRIRAVWSEPWLVAWIFYECYWSNIMSLRLSKCRIVGNHMSQLMSRLTERRIMQGGVRALQCPLIPMNRLNETRVCYFIMFYVLSISEWSVFQLFYGTSEYLGHNELSFWQYIYRIWLQIVQTICIKYNLY